MKLNRYGQAAILSEHDRKKIRKCFSCKRDKLLFDIACYTGERWGAILQLRIDDCYSVRTQPRDEITFRRETRKGKQETRQVPVHPLLKDSLALYKPTGKVYLFESKTIARPISFQNANYNLQVAIERAGLKSKGFSTHSTRRTFITRLSEMGVDLRTIQSITGHRSLATLQRYIEESPERKAKAVEALSL